MFVAKTMPQELQSRWEALGFIEAPIFIEREAIRFPVPLEGEPGHDPDYWRTRPDIYRPGDRAELARELSYAHALSVEADDSSGWLRRYRAGEHEQVWNELTALGDGVRNPEILPHAIAVARETMRRCRTNVETLYLSLVKAGYPFESPDEAFVSPGADVLDQIARLESEAGPLPLSLCAWYELVGSINFNPQVEEDDEMDEASWSDDPLEEKDDSGGSFEIEPVWNQRIHALIAEQYPDPLWISSIESALAETDGWYRYRYRIDIAPDYYHKANVSGGEPYATYVPDASADALLQNEPHETTFVNYLRLCFHAGGFPGITPQNRSLLPDIMPPLLPI